MKLLSICLSLVSLVTATDSKGRPELQVMSQFLSKYLPIKHETPLVLSAVNIGNEIAYNVTLSLLRQLNASGPFSIKGPLVVKYAKMYPGETVQHIVFVTLARNPFFGEDTDNILYMNIAAAPARVVYQGKNGEMYDITSNVTQDKVPQMMIETTARKYVCSRSSCNGHYWLVFCGITAYLNIIPIYACWWFKHRYGEGKSVGSENDEETTNSSDSDCSEAV